MWEEWLLNKTILPNYVVKEQFMGSTYDRGRAFSTPHRRQPRCTPPHTWPQPCRIPGTCPPCRRRRLPRCTRRSKCWGPPAAEDRAWASGRGSGAGRPSPSEPGYLAVALPEGAVPDDLAFAHSPGFAVGVGVTWESLSYGVWTFLRRLPAISELQCSGSYWGVPRCEIILEIAVAVSTKTTHFALATSERKMSKLLGI